MEREQRVRDLPAEAERGQATRPMASEGATRLGVPVLDPDGRRVGELTDATVPLDENVPRVVVGLDEEVRRRYRLETSAVDVESRLLRKDADGTVRLLEPLPQVLRREGFDL